MPFVKLDCGILDSTLWLDQDAREIFITALLMAVPYELEAPTAQIKVRSLELTGWQIPIGWYGFIPAAGTGIARRAGLASDRGLDALERLCAPEADSRTPDYEGRRLARIDGGFIVLNYMRYRERDYTGAERQRRFREKVGKDRNTVTSRRNTVTPRYVTQADAEVEVDAETKEKSKALVALKRDAAVTQPHGAKANGNGKHPRGQPLPAIIESLHTLTTETTSRLTKDAFRGVMVEITFAYWAKRLGHEQALLDDKRRRVISARLVENGDNLSELLYAVDGALRDDWVMGRDPKSSKRYDGVETLFQDRAHVEKYASVQAPYRSGVTHPMAVKYAGAPSND